MTVMLWTIPLMILALIGATVPLILHSVREHRRSYADPTASRRVDPRLGIDLDDRQLAAVLEAAEAARLEQILVRAGLRNKAA